MNSYFYVQRIATVFIFFLHVFSFGMEQPNKSFRQRNEEFADLIDNRQILSFQGLENSMLIMVDNGFNPALALRFCVSKNKDHCLVLTPVDTIDELKKLSRHYSLFDAARDGRWEDFKSLLIDEQIEGNIKDNRLFLVCFNILRSADQKICRLEDLMPGNQFRLARSVNPILAPFPYNNTVGFAPVDYALRNYKHHILQIMIEHPSVFAIDSQQKKEIEDLLVRVKEEEAFLSNMRDTVRDISQCDQLDKLGIGSLGKEYASLIAFKEKEGEALIGRFNEWKRYEMLTVNIVQTLCEAMRLYPHLKKPFLPKNIVHFSYRIAQDEKLRSLNKAQEFFTNVVALSFFYSENNTNNEFNKIYYDMLDLLVRNGDSKALLRALCDDKNNNNIFGSTIKPFMQKILFQNALARQLTCANPPFVKDIAASIAAHWQPDEEYKNYFRKLPDLKRKLEDKSDQGLEKKQKHENDCD